MKLDRTMTPRFFSLLVFFSAVIVFLSTPKAFGQEQDAWEFNLAPFYLWAVNLEGDATVRGVTSPVDLPFDQIFDNLEGALIIHFEALHENTWGFIADFNYLDISQNAQVAIFDIDVSVKETVAELDGFYRITHGVHQFDMVAGVRYNEVKLKYNIRNLPFYDSRTENWWDPVVGVRYRYPIADRWTLQLRGDIGGFGIGSDFTWQTIGLIDYQPWKYVSLVGGYRALSLDYETGSGNDVFKYDVLLHGPVLGLNIRW